MLPEVLALLGPVFAYQHLLWQLDASPAQCELQFPPTPWLSQSRQPLFSWKISSSVSQVDFCVLAAVDDPTLH